MKANILNARSIVEQYNENCRRIGDIADLCEKENRQRNEAEEAEYRQLTADNQVLQMRMQAQASPVQDNEQRMRSVESLVRENMKNGVQTEITLRRDAVNTTQAEAGGIVPLNIQEIVEPLAEGLILDKVGLPLMTGLAGDYVWPTYEAIEASIVGEGVALTDTPVALSKLTAQPQRIGVAIPVTRQTIIQSQGVVEDIVNKMIPQGVAKLINKIMFSTTKVTGATTLAGPFANIAAKDVVKLSAVPTFADFVKLKAKVLASGVDGEALCFIMTKAQKAIAESTSKDAGSGMMLCENDMIAGVPVFTTQYIGEGNVGIGDFRYQPMGLFGDMAFTVDPYSQARKDCVDFVFNVNYGTVTLRPDAFALGTAATA